MPGSTIEQDDSEPGVPDLQCTSVEEYGDEGLPDHLDMIRFWEGARCWLAKRNVDLYETCDKKVDDVQYYRWLNHREIGESPAPLPFATCVPADSKELRPARWIDRFGYAHNAQHRDLVVRLVDPRSDHYQIFRRLLEDKAFSDPTKFPCVLPPLAILDTPHNFSFVPMPMWGQLTTSCMLNMETAGEVLRFIDCTLQGLTTLHGHRIAHRDIDEVNIMVNYYRYDDDIQAQAETLREHRKSGRVCYALMDYNQSIILPRDTCIRTCRRPADEALYGSAAYKPWDIALGEPTYNPFAYDVGMLGNIFRTYLAEVVPSVPGCAALFDRMTTWVSTQRMTAEEALEFFRNSTENLEDATLNTPVKLKVAQCFDEYWDKLPPEMYRSWSRFRTPPVTWWSNVLEWFLQFKPTRHIILVTRRVLDI